MTRPCRPFIRKLAFLCCSRKMVMPLPSLLIARYLDTLGHGASLPAQEMAATLAYHVGYGDGSGLQHRDCTQA